MSQDFPLVVALAVHNGARWLPFCLGSLARQTRQDFMLMLIDNASVDGSLQIIHEFLEQHAELAQRTKVVSNKQNVGFAKAYNQALLWTASEAVLVLNQDVLLAPDYLELTLGGLGKQPRAGAVMGKLLQWKFDPTTFHEQDLVVSAAQIDSVGLQITRSRRVINRGQGQADHGQFEQEQEVFGVPATVALYRRQAIAEVSPLHQTFDEAFISYKEDVDLAWRLQRAGWQSWYVPSALVYHDRNLSGGEQDSLRQLGRRHKHFPRKYKVYSWVNHWAVLVKNDSWLNLLRDLPWFLGHELLKFIYLCGTDPVVVWVGIGKFIRLLPLFLSERRALRQSRRVDAKTLRHWWVSI